MKKALAILFLLFNDFFSFAQQDQRTIERVESYLSKMEEVGFMGSVLVEINNKKVISKGYGFSNLEKKIRNTSATVFDVGSVTKQFTAAAILKLESEGKLSTNDVITKYFKAVPTDKAKITIHDLLRHQSGLPGGVGGDYEKITEAEFINRVLSSKLRFEPGARFSYSNIGYSLLAMIVEQASKTDYETYLYNNLWRPAGMEQTGYSRPEFNNDNIATGYENDDKVWGKPTDHEWDGKAPYWHLKGNGGILSTIEDLYKWNEALLTDKIISSGAKKKMYQPELRKGETDNPYYAYGWDVMITERKTMVVQHNGSNHIFYTDFNRYINEGITIISMSNKQDGNFLELNREISRIIFDPDYQPPVPIANNAANRQFTDELINVTLEQGWKAASELYKNRKSELNLIETVINSKGYDLLEEKEYEKAVNIFMLNVSAFPLSYNAYDSLGEAYMNEKDNEMAIKCYQKSLELNPQNKNAEEMLQKLQQK